MLEILLTILKVLLLIVAGLLAIVLLLVILILFAPVHYKIDAKYKDDIEAKARVRFLIFTVDVFYDAVEKGIKYVVKAAGIKINLDRFLNSSEMSDEQSNLNQQQSKQNTDSDDLPENIDRLEADEKISEVSDEAWGDELPESENKDASDDKQIEEVSDNNEEAGNNSEEADSNAEISEVKQIEEESDNNEDSDNNENKGFRDKVINILEKIKEFFKKASDFIQKFSPDNIEKELKKLERKLKLYEKKLKLIKKFIDYEPTQKTIKYLKKYIPKTFKHVMPRKVKGYIHYGLGDPYNTGKLTGYLSLMPFMYHKKFYIQPDFYEKVIDFDIHMKGHLLLGYVIRIILRKEIWQTYRAWTKVQEKLGKA